MMARKRRTNRPYRTREPIPALEEAVLCALSSLTGQTHIPVTALAVTHEVRTMHPRERRGHIPTARDIEIVRRMCDHLVATGRAEACAEQPVLTGRRPRMFCAIAPLAPAPDA